MLIWRDRRGTEWQNCRPRPVPRPRSPVFERHGPVVITDNLPAIATYQKLDFVIEGTLKNAAVIARRIRDIHVMSR